MPDEYIGWVGVYIFILMVAVGFAYACKWIIKKAIEESIGDDIKEIKSLLTPKTGWDIDTDDEETPQKDKELL